MRVLISPNAFKDCLDAVSVARILARSFSDLSPDVETYILPVADGGDGFSSLFEALRCGTPVVPT